MPNACFFIGLPRNFKNKFLIYPPKIADVVSNEEFSLYRHIFTITADDIKDQIKKKGGEETKIPTPFEFLLINCYYDKNVAEMTKKAFEFFIHQKITILFEQKIVIVGDIEQVVQDIQSIDELIVLKEDDYFDFQNAIRESLGEKPEEPPEPEDPNEHPEIRRIKALARERDRIKARRQPKNGISLEMTLVAICCMGIGITPLNIGEMSYASIGPIMNMMQDKEKYDIDIRSLLAGADSKKIKPKYWIRNVDKE